LRVGLAGMVLPARIIAWLEQRAPEDGHELRELRVHRGAVEALVVVLPEHLPVALDGLAQAMPDGEGSELPCLEAAERQVEALLKGWRTLAERDENEAAPLGNGQPIEGYLAALEAIALLHRGGLQQLPLQAVAPTVIGADDARGAEAALGAAAQGG